MREGEPTIKFSSFENFIIKTEQKENPRKMQYISSLVPIPDREYQKEMNAFAQEGVRQMLKGSGIDKGVLAIEPLRHFLQDSWQRDNFLYFNGTYFPARFIDSKGQYRPEQEALSVEFVKTGKINSEKYLPKILSSKAEAIMSIGEGGFYYPDNENKTLFISEGVVREGTYTNENLSAMHKKIFGEDVQTVVLPRPETDIGHLDTHFSIIPNTKTILLENHYYSKLCSSEGASILERLGYKILQISKTKLNAPLNIFYTEDSKGKIFAFLNRNTPSDLKKILRDNNIEVKEIPEEMAEGLDAHGGGIRCITNEFHTKDPDFLRKLGYKI